MKKIYLTLLSIGLIAASTQAQYTLDASNTEPSAGVTYNLLVADSGSVNPGAGGADVLWDFEGIATPSTTTAAWTAFDAAGVPDIFYSSADLKLEYDVHFQFFNTASGSLDLVGRGTRYLGALQTMPYATGSPFSYISYPFDYQDNSTNFITLSYSEVLWDSSSQTGNPLTGDVEGNVIVEYDGYGEIVMPDGKIVSDVARIKITESFVRGVGVSIETVENEFYEFREAFTPMWVARLEFYDVQVYNSTDERLRNYNYFLESSEIQSVSELISNSEDFIVYPNPTTNQANLNFEVTERSDLVVSVVDIMGKETLVEQRSNVSPGIYNETIDLTNFAKGYYLIKIKHGSTIKAQKIQKQ